MLGFKKQPTNDQIEAAKKYLLERCEEDEETGCWNWTKGLRNGYGYGRAKGVRYLCVGDRANRQSYRVFNGPIEEGLHILHTCDNRKCINPAHLYADTHEQNMQDKADSDVQKGELNGHAALTNKQVKEVEKLLRKGNKSMEEIGNKFGVHQTVISNINMGRTWSSVTKGPYPIRAISIARIDGHDDIKVANIKWECLQDNTWGANSRIAKKYGVSAMYVGNLRKGKTKNHIEPMPPITLDLD